MEFDPKLSMCRGELRTITHKFIHRVFEDSFSQHCGIVQALEFTDKQGKVQNVDYNTLNQVSNQIANSILSLTINAEPNQDNDCVVAVCVPPSDNLVCVLLAILKAGCAYLPLDIGYSESQVKFILQQIKPVLVIYDDANENPLLSNFTTSISIRNIKTDSEFRNKNNITKIQTLTQEKSNLACIFYTSGSNGVAKAVRETHTAILNRLMWTWEYHPFSNTEKYCIFHNHSTSVDSICEIWSPLLRGIILVVVPKAVSQDTEKFIRLLVRYKIERAMLSPIMIRNILAHLPKLPNNKQLPHLKRWINCKEPLSLELALRFFNHYQDNAHLLSTYYGCAEVLADVICFTYESAAQLQRLERVAIGHPISNTAVYVLDEKLNVVPLNTSGEIYIAGLNLSKGYVSNMASDEFIVNAHTDDEMFATLFRTGDSGFINDGLIYYEGKMNSQIKVQGQQIDLPQLESSLNSIAGVKNGLVFGYHPGEEDQALIGFATLENKCNMTGADIADELHFDLKDYIRPLIMPINELPLLVSGKIDRVALVHTYENMSSTREFKYKVSITSQLPRDVTLILLETIQSTIGSPPKLKTALKKNFFELGGNSLNAILTVAELKRKGFPISVNSFIEATNLEDIITIMSNGSEAANSSNTGLLKLEIKPEMNLNSVPITQDDRGITIKMLFNTYRNKNVIEELLEPPIEWSDCLEVVNYLFDTSLDFKYCFAVQDKGEKTVGLSFNFAGDNKSIMANLKGILRVVFKFEEVVEARIWQKDLPKDHSKILRTFTMLSDVRLGPDQNIIVTSHMMDEIFKLAKENNFTSIMSINSSPLTQQLATYVHGYQTITAVQINQYMDVFGVQPFGSAPDSEKCFVQLKNIVNFSN